jgi:hypothetical protein
MSRTQIPFAIQDGLGNALSGTASVYQRGTVTPVSVYAAQSGGSPLTQPVAFTNGTLPIWADTGSYDLAITTAGGSYTKPWESVAATVPVVLNALAVDTDKIAWEYPTGTDVVELYGSMTPAGFQIAASDNLNTDTTALYTPRFGDGTQQINWTGSTFVLPGTGSYGTVWSAGPAAWGDADDQARMKVKGRVSGTFAGTGAFGCGFMRTSDGQTAQATFQDNGHVIIHWNTVGTGANTEDLTTGLTFQFNHYYWLELTRAGNNRTVTVYDTDGTTVLYTNTGAIPPAVLSIFGTGQLLKPAIGLTRNVTGGHDGEIDQVEYYTQQSETHDLFVAITPASGGTRTVRRVFGSRGSAVFRSDFRSSFGAPNIQTASYQLTASDSDHVVEMNAAGATTVTIPSNAVANMPIGAMVEIARIGAGTVTIAGGSGVTLHSKSGFVTVSAQYGLVRARQRVLDEWHLTGDLA